MIIENQIFDKLRLIKEQDVNIKKLQNNRNKEYEELDNLLQKLGFKISKCKRCFGTGQISYTSGYGECNTEYMDCNDCRGTGYSLIKLE